MLLPLSHSVTESDQPSTDDMLIAAAVRVGKTMDLPDSKSI